MISAQSKITMNIGFFGNIYYVGENKVSGNFVKTYMKEQNQHEASIKFGQAQSTKLWSDIIGLPAGAMLGWELGNVIVGKKTNSAFLIGGGVGSLISIIMGANAQKKFKESINMYNQGKGLSYKLEATENGYGLVYRF